MARLFKHPLEAFRDGNGKMSQAEAAALVGITQEMWSRLERGTAYASPAVAKRISDLTGIALERLLNLGDNDSKAADRDPIAGPLENPKDLP